MSHHSHHNAAEVLGGAAVGLLIGSDISRRQKATGESYGKAATVSIVHAVLGGAAIFIAFAWTSWGLLMHPLITIPSLFLLILLFLASRPSTAKQCGHCGVRLEAVANDGGWQHVTGGVVCQDGHVAQLGQWTRPLESYPVTVAAHAPRDFHRPTPYGLDVPRRRG